MCINPIKMTVSGREVEVACRRCWRCRANRLNDWFGRCYAERVTSVATHFVTLTYGPEAGPRAVTLYYPDVQNWLKVLRNSGDSKRRLRYLIAGEYGTLKGRTHWHVLLFWHSRPPDVIERYTLYERTYDDEWWPHGLTQWKACEDEDIRYVCKYMVEPEFVGEKNSGEYGAQETMYRFSTVPPLGAYYFASLAERYVRQRLSPQSGVYWFGDVRHNGKPKQFWMSDATAKQFVQHFVRRWEETHGREPWPPSDFVQETLDKAVKPHFRPVDKAVKVHEVYAHARAKASRPWILPPEDAVIAFSEVHNTWYCDAPRGGRYYWSFNEKGERAWRDVIVTTEMAARLREVSVKQAALDGSTTAYRIASGRLDHPDRERGPRPSRGR